MEIEEDELPLHCATRRGDIDAVRAILSTAGCEVDAIDGASHQLALHIACEKGFDGIVGLLLDRGASLQKCSRLLGNGEEGYAALNWAIRNGRVSTVKLLLERGADIHRLAYGGTPLHWACVYGHLNVASVLLNSGADVNAGTENDVGCTPLHYAALFGRKEIVQLLLSRNAGISTFNNYGRSVVHRAWQGSYPEVAELLLRTAGASTDAEVHCAVREDLVKVLLNCEADVNASGCDGLTALHWACRGKSAKVAECLLRSGARINAAVFSPASRYFVGYTPLHFAVLGDNWREEPQIQIDLIELLLRWGADVNAKEVKGWTPLRYLSRFSSRLDHEQAIAKLFAKHVQEMRAHNLLVDETNLKECLLKDHGPSRNFSKACRTEIESMRGTKIGESSVTFFDVFTKGQLRLADYMSNEDIAQVSQSGDIERVFPIYSDHLRTRFEQGRERLDLLQKSDSVLSLGNFRYVPYECMRKLKTYLSEEDLKNIVNVKALQP